VIIVASLLHNTSGYVKMFHAKRKLLSVGHNIIFYSGCETFIFETFGKKSGIMLDIYPRKGEINAFILLERATHLHLLIFKKFI
jgi:hypothetical protein